MAFDIEEQLNTDLEYIKTYVSVDIHFQLYLKEIFDKEQLHCVSYKNNKIVNNNRNSTQYICSYKEIKKTKKILWIPIKRIMYARYSILAEMRWTNEDHNKLSFIIEGYTARNKLLKILKNWAVDNEIFIELHIKTADDALYYCEKKYQKYVWQKEYTRIQ